MIQLKKIPAIIFMPFFMILFSTLVSHAQLEGSVRDSKQKQIPGAAVTATDSSGKLVVNARSDHRGFYSLKGLKPGKYKLEVKAEGYLSAFHENVIITPAPEDTDEKSDTYHAIRLNITLLPVKLPD